MHAIGEVPQEEGQKVHRERDDAAAHRAHHLPGSAAWQLTLWKQGWRVSWWSEPACASMDWQGSQAWGEGGQWSGMFYLACSMSP